MSWEVARLLVTTPLPISWVAQVFDQLQLRTMNARVRGREDRLVQQTWALLAMAADGLAGTGDYRRRTWPGAVAATSCR